MADYETSHPWITFKAEHVNRLHPRSWMLLGEARAMCKQLKGVALRPERMKQLLLVSLDKGILATAAIEGNTLGTAQVAAIREAIHDGTYEPQSPNEYQEVEISNLLTAINEIDKQAADGKPLSITKETICDINRELLTDTEHEPDAVPGGIRTHSVDVGRGLYRGAPAQDCEFLLDELAGWLAGETFRSDDEELAFGLSVIGAIYAHLYLAWIHPFGDGNGRTARMLEYVLLTRTGTIPRVATHLLWNHYYNTLRRYYRALMETSESLSPLPFLKYAIEGFVEGLREHVREVEEEQAATAWVNHVHEQMSLYPSTPARDRQRALVLAMDKGKTYNRSQLRSLTPAVEARYSDKTYRTLSRDLNRLVDVGLIRKQNLGWRTCDDQLRVSD